MTHVTSSFSGVGAMMVFNPATTVIQTFFVKKRGLANGVSMVGTSIAIFVWPPVIQWLMDEFGWRGALLLKAAMLLHGVPLALLYTERQRHATEEKDIKPANVECSSSENKTNLRKISLKLKRLCLNSSGFKIWKNLGFVLQTLCYFCISFTYYLYLNFIPVRALSIGIDKYRAAFLISVYGIANAFARVFIALTIDRKCVSRLAMYTIFTVAFGVVTIFIPYLTEYALLVFGMVIAGFCIGKFFSFSIKVFFKRFGQSGFLCFI